MEDERTPRPKGFLAKMDREECATLIGILERIDALGMAFDQKILGEDRANLGKWSKDLEEHKQRIDAIPEEDHHERAHEHALRDRMDWQEQLTRTDQYYDFLASAEPLQDELRQFLKSTELKYRPGCLLTWVKRTKENQLPSASSLDGSMPYIQRILTPDISAMLEAHKTFKTIVAQRIDDNATHGMALEDKNPNEAKHGEARKKLLREGGFDAFLDEGMKNLRRELAENHLHYDETSKLREDIFDAQIKAREAAHAVSSGALIIHGTIANAKNNLAKNSWLDGYS